MEVAGRIGLLEALVCRLRALWPRSRGTSAFWPSSVVSPGPLYPHEVTDDAEQVRIAAAVGDEDLVDHLISTAQRRGELNPSVLSCSAALAHCRGIWSESVDELRVAMLYKRDLVPSHKHRRSKIWA
jgi:hypothetical protein